MSWWDEAKLRFWIWLVRQIANVFLAVARHAGLLAHCDFVVVDVSHRQIVIANVEEQSADETKE